MYRLLGNLLETALLFIVFVSCDMGGMKKYIIVLVLSFFLFFLGRKKKWDGKALICVALPAITYLILGCSNAILTANIYENSIKIFMFWLIPLIFSLALNMFYGKDMSHLVDVEFLSCVLAYVSINARFLIKFFNAESTFAFASGAFFIYYVYKKKWGFCAISALMMYLTEKRIVILAVVISLSVMGVMWLFQKDKKLAVIIWGFVTSIICGYLWLICSGKFLYYCQGIGINTNGRAKMYEQMVEWFEEPVVLIGRGIGIVEELLSAWNFKVFANLHNDLLKFYFELGIVGLLVFLLSYGVVLFLSEKLYGKDKMCVVLSVFVYSMVLYATDNVSIYILYLIPYYSILFAIISSEKEKTIKEKDV